MPLWVDVAVAAPLWRPLTYSVPAELAPLIGPLSRLTVPLRGRPRLGFAMSAPQDGDAAGLKPVADVLDDAGAPALPGQMLGFFSRAAAHYQTPLGQAIAWALPAGLGQGGGGRPAPRPAEVPLVSPRPGAGADSLKPETQAAQIMRHLLRAGPVLLPELRARWPRATALVRSLESAGLVAISHRPAVRDLSGRWILAEPEPERLTDGQQAALDEVLPRMDQGGFAPFLLHGVTGSGKTEVYVAACRRALAAGRSALVLAPEIGLVLRLEGLLRQRLGPDAVAVLHSGLSAAERRAQWWAAASGRAKVVVGARSAVFAPLQDLGIICVDEEQDEAYKQSDRLRYHARDLALLRGQEQGCPVLLGSATPAVTTWHRARQGELSLLRMPSRVREAAMPAMEVVDLRSAGKLAGGFLSRRLAGALAQTVAEGRQAILFLNRRGFAPALLCPACGKTVGCPACSLSLTLHQKAGRLTCHTCGHWRPLPETCPSCGAPAENMLPLGLGTEQVAARLSEIMPEARVARLDSDTAASPSELRKVLKKVAAHEVDVVVGTQMITKGHHFPLISLVGVLLADQALAVPDFRAGERAFHLLTQVAGRAGREGGPSRVIIQTFDPEHHAVRSALEHQPESFYRAELEDRRALGYPPFMRLMSLRLEAPDQGVCQRAARNLGRALDEARAKAGPGVLVLGPAPAPLARSKGRWRQLLLLKAPRAGDLGRVLRLALHRMGPLPGGVRLAVDVDPINLA